MNIVTVNRKNIFILVFVSLILFFGFSQLLLLWMENKFKNIIKQSHNINKYVEKQVVQTTIKESDDSVPMFQRLVELDTTVKMEELSYEKKLKKAIPCYDRFLKPKIEQHGNFWVLSNYVRASRQYRCFESIAYTTQGDYTFLDNLLPLVQRWDGPISVALHAPATDFEPTINSIAYLRNCLDDRIKEHVTFHLLFDMGHTPIKENNRNFDFPLWELYEDTYDCSNAAPYENVTYKDLYKIKANISYPINVARNVARDNAQTYFILASDIELYPSINIINNFLQMILNKPNLFENENPMVFALPVFQVLGNQSSPTNKTTLVKMIKNNTAFSFHEHICRRCHAIPQLDEWVNLEVSDKLDIFISSKRQGKFKRWESVYIGTNEDPFFDEQLDWERHGNKMPQAYALCLLNYDYMVLDNAFLVHKPGIKKGMFNKKVIPKTTNFIRNVLGVQFDAIYGKRKGCIA